MVCQVCLCRCKLLKGLEARAGIEPAHKGFADLSLTTWVPRLGVPHGMRIVPPRSSVGKNPPRRCGMERETRLELATLALARRCSTTELLPLDADSSIPGSRKRVKPRHFAAKRQLRVRIPANLQLGIAAPSMRRAHCVIRSSNRTTLPRKRQPKLTPQPKFGSGSWQASFSVDDLLQPQIARRGANTEHTFACDRYPLVISRGPVLELAERHVQCYGL